MSLITIDKDTWDELDRTHLKMVLAQASKPLNTETAKNVIIFVGDGMSTATLTAARIEKGHIENPFEPHIGDLEVDLFPYTALAKVSLGFKEMKRGYLMNFD